MDVTQNIAVAIDLSRVVRMVSHPREILYLLVMDDGALRSVGRREWCEVLQLIKGDPARRLVPQVVGRDDTCYVVEPWLELSCSFDSSS